MFKFTLEPVLDHRNYQKDVLQKELEIKKGMLFEEKKKLKNYKDIKKQKLQELRKKKLKENIVPEICLYFNFIDRLSEEIKTQKTKVIEAEKKFVKTRDQLIGALQKKKILEKMKERQWAEVMQEMAKDEQNFQNEIATNSFSRNLQQ